MNVFCGPQLCPRCRELKPLDKNHNNEQGRVSRQKVHGGSRHYHLVRRYGISAAETDEMLQAQAALCPICRRPLSESPHVDHNHATGDVRGLLCFTCNSGLGNFGDDVERLERAAAYLRGDLTAPSRIAPGVYDVAGTTWRAQDSMPAAG